MVTVGDTPHFNQGLFIGMENMDKNELEFRGLM